MRALSAAVVLALALGVCAQGTSAAAGTTVRPRTLASSLTRRQPAQAAETSVTTSPVSPTTAAPTTTPTPTTTPVQSPTSPTSPAQQSPTSPAAVSPTTAAQQATPTQAAATTQQQQTTAAVVQQTSAAVIAQPIIPSTSGNVVRRAGSQRFSHCRSSSLSRRRGGR